MQCQHCPKRFFDAWVDALFHFPLPRERDFILMENIHRIEFGLHTRSHSERQREIQDPNTEIGAFLKASALEGPRRAILQASTLLSHWDGTWADSRGTCPFVLFLTFFDFIIHCAFADRMDRIRSSDRRHQKLPRRFTKVPSQTQPRRIHSWIQGCYMCWLRCDILVEVKKKKTQNKRYAFWEPTWTV